MTFSVWYLILAAVLLALILNLKQWRRDLEHIRALAASQEAVPSLEPADDSMWGGKAPRVSFLVAAWNEERSITACLEAILRLGYADIEVVLSAGGEDRTWQIASSVRDPRLILLQQRVGDGKSKSLARCLERATGEIIYLLDADCRITGAAFAKMLHPILSQDEEVVSCMPNTPLPEQSDVALVVIQSIRIVYGSLYQPDYVPYLVGKNCVLRRGTLERAGGFRTDVRIAEDYDLSKRLARQGTRVRYGRATFPVEFPTRVKSYLKQQARWLRGPVMIGMHYRAYSDVSRGLRISLTGCAMLVTPLVTLALGARMGTQSVLVRLILTAWIYAYSHSLFSRARCLDVASRWMGTHVSPRALALLPVFVPIDFLAWTIPLGQYPFRALRDRW